LWGGWQSRTKVNSEQCLEGGGTEVKKKVTFGSAGRWEWRVGKDAEKGVKGKGGGGDAWQRRTKRTAFQTGKNSVGGTVKPLRNFKKKNRGGRCYNLEEKKRQNGPLLIGDPLVRGKERKASKQRKKDHSVRGGGVLNAKTFSS